MLSSRSSKEDDRIKMKEEAKKQRIMKARAAKLPHVTRSECRVGDPGFVSRKVAPNNEDDLSVLLKNGLIDYKELLGTFRTREDYRYLGIDNVPGTPEVNIPGFEKIFENPKSAPRLNGLKLSKDDTSSRNAPVLRTTIKEEPSSPGTVNDPTQRHSPNAAVCDKQLNMGTVKKEPVSPKNRSSQPLNDASSIQSNGDVSRSKTTQPKSKPSVLKMPSESTSPLNPNDETQRANPSKIESIVQEMTEIFPPLTDIQTPVKTQDTRFPFPHLPLLKDNVNISAISGEHHNRGKSDEILKRDLIVTSDDESDEDNEQNRASKADPVLLSTNCRLSASSSSSSDGSSSDSSSESESSDSENESREPRGKSENRKAIKRPPYSNLTNGDETAVNSPLPPTQAMRHTQQKSTGKVAPKGKVLREEELGKQASPLNSISKDARKESDISPMRNELSGISNFNHNDTDFLVTYSVSAMQRNLNSTLSPEKVDTLANCSRTDSDMQDVDQGLGNGDYEPFPYLGEGLIFDKPEDFIPPNFDSESLVAMIGRSPDRFDPMNLPMVDCGGLSAPSTVNLDPIISSEFDTDHSVHKDKANGYKRTGGISMSFAEDEGSEQFSTSGNHKIKSSTPMQSKMPSKKDKQHEWLKTLFPANKNFDLPYVDVDELISPAKASNSIPLKVQIPLSKIHHPGKKAPRSENNANNPELQKRQKVKGKDINLYASKKTKCKDNDKAKSNCKVKNNSITTDKPRQSVGKDIEQIKSLMRELSSKASEDEEVVDVISTPSPLKSASKPEARVSGKSIHGTPVSYIAKKEPTPHGATSAENSDKATGLEKSKDTSKKISEGKKRTSRKRSSSSLSYGDVEDESTRPRTSKKHKLSKDRINDNSLSRPVLEHSDDSNTGFKSPNSVVSNHTIGGSKLLVSIKLSDLKRFPGISEEEEEEETTQLDYSKKEVDGKSDAVAGVSSVAGPVWKPPPNIKIPRIAKLPEDESNSKSTKACSDGIQDCADTDTSSTCSSSCKPSKEASKSRKNRPINEGRGVKRREWERTLKNGNTNVCGMCGSLQKDSGRDPIRLGAYKTSYIEYLNLGKRSKHRADCLDASERAPKYIDAVLKYIQYLVGLEITGKRGTKNGFEEYMCITSQCIDLVDFVVNQYGKKENNNISNYDSRFVYLCLRLQSVLYFKLYAAKKDSAARYSKLLSEYFKVHRSPHRVNIKGSTGTPSPMSPTSSHTGSVASFGSSVSNGSYEKMLNLGSVVSIPTETFERMQQYFTYTKYLLHGHRLWDDADAIANQCQEFINVVSRRVGAITIQSSMLHLVDYISTGLQVVKDTESC